MTRAGLTGSKPNITGTLRKVGPEDVNTLSAHDTIAYISCDGSAYTGNIGVGETIAAVISNTPSPAAVVLYTTRSDHCNYTVDPVDRGVSRYSEVFSVADPSHARAILKGLGSGNATDSGTSRITINLPSKLSDQSQGIFPSDGNVNGNSGNSPTSSVAMIILYSVTGIITALFIGVIIIGTIRAHRHPERYGPRNIAGRPRQSRARGIARAVLETLPIVKFGDLDDTNPEPKTDIEMASQDNERSDVTRPGSRQNQASQEPRQEQAQSIVDRSQPGTSPHQRGSMNPDGHDASLLVSNEIESGQIGPALSPRSRTSHGQDTAAGDTPVCPICTDDFIKGQDVRILPCNHKFHPNCVDPWLVNVSGTCPLCRIDLDPSSAEGASRRGSTSGSDPPPLDQGSENADTGAEGRNTSRHHRRLTEYLHNTLGAVSERDSTMEQRLNTARNLRRARSAEQMATNADAVETTEETSHRARLTARLRDRFRIRTRRHGEESSHESPGEAS
ncbi:hypothetical protein VTO42DRAFT_8514 [Malbranchea cinnamomea]